MKSKIGRKGTVLLAVVVLGATAVAGGALAAVAAHSTATTTTTKVNANEKDYKILLSRKSVPPGVVKFVVHNSSATTHKFAVKGNGVSKSIAGTIQPGQTKTLSVTLKKGTYTVFCPIHVSQGMKTTLTVGTSGGTTSTTSTTSTWG